MDEKILLPSKVLFIALTGIGNVIMLTPALTNIKKNLPKSKVSVLLDSYTEDVLEKNPYVDEIIIYPTNKNLLLKILFLLKLRKKKFDISFYSYPNNNIMSSIFSFLSGAKLKVNFHYKFLFLKKCEFLNTISVDADENTHDVDKNLNLLRAYNLKIYSRDLFVPISEEDKIYVDNLLKDKVKESDELIGMHIGSDGLDKMWKTKNFASLVDKIKNRESIKVILVGAEKERNLVDEFPELQTSKVINLMGNTTISQSTEVIRRCKVFIANDSAPMHMAVAIGTKVIGIFIASDVRRTRPYGKKHIVLTNLTEYINGDNKNIIYVEKITPEVVFQQLKISLTK